MQSFKVELRILSETQFFEFTHAQPCRIRIWSSTNTPPPPRVIPPDVEKHIRPIYKDLSKDDLLIKCLGGHTQNANESFNSTVWRFCPKHLHSRKKIVETAAFIAAGTFNEGHAAILLVMDMLNITIGQYWGRPIGRGSTRAREQALQRVHQRGSYGSKGGPMGWEGVFRRLREVAVWSWHRRLKF